MGLRRKSMSEVRSLKRLAALSVLAAGLAGCGGTIPLRSSDPTPTPVFTAIEPASPVPTLSMRQMRPPALAPNASCPVSSGVDLGAVAPNYGFGVGPVYLSGQDTWYSGGQVAILMVASKYSGPLLVRGFQLSGEGISKVTLAELPPTDFPPADKEKQHSVEVVPGAHTTAGGLELQAVLPSTLWRAWFGILSTDSPGCFGLQVDGDLFTEFIVFSVLAGTPPPG